MPLTFERHVPFRVLGGPNDRPTDGCIVRFDDVELDRTDRRTDRERVSEASLSFILFLSFPSTRVAYLLCGGTKASIS